MEDTLAVFTTSPGLELLVVTVVLTISTLFCVHMWKLVKPTLNLNGANKAHAVASKPSRVPPPRRPQRSKPLRLLGPAAYKTLLAQVRGLFLGVVMMIACLNIARGESFTSPGVLYPGLLLFMGIGVLISNQK